MHFQAADPWIHRVMKVPSAGFKYWFPTRLFRLGRTGAKSTTLSLQYSKYTNLGGGNSNILLCSTLTWGRFPFWPLPGEDVHPFWLQQYFSKQVETQPPISLPSIIRAYNFPIMGYWVVVSNICYFHPYLGKIPILTKNHQLDQLVPMNLA